jgi:acetylornithine/succinyldiaminopimelate/putrescine aminotransferase
MQDWRWPTYRPRNITLERVVHEDDNPNRGAVRIQAADGKQYLDAVGGIGCLPLGHSPKRWVEAMTEQMNTMMIAAGPFWTEVNQALAKRIVDLSPVKDGRVFFGNTGTEVTEASIKVALKATGRDVVIGFEKAFHGRSLGSLSLTANPKYRGAFLSTPGDDVQRFAHMNVVRATYGDLEGVEKLFSEYGERVAMVCLEPVQGEGGINPAKREFLVGLHGLCRKHGAMLALDEIQAGSGRTGDFSAWTTLVGDDPELYPDIIWWAKALGGGFPISAVVARGDIAETMQPGTHGSTFGGNPLACRAGMVTLDIMDDDDLFARAGKQLATLQGIAKAKPISAVREVRGLGAMLGIDFGDADLVAKLIGATAEQGLLVTASGGTAIRWLFPYWADETILGEAWDRLGKAVASVT